MFQNFTILKTFDENELIELINTFTPEERHYALVLEELGMIDVLFAYIRESIKLEQRENKETHSLTEQDLKWELKNLPYSGYLLNKCLYIDESVMSEEEIKEKINILRNHELQKGHEKLVYRVCRDKYEALDTTYALCKLFPCSKFYAQPDEEYECYDEFCISSDDERYKKVEEYIENCKYALPMTTDKILNLINIEGNDLFKNSYDFNKELILRKLDID